MLKIVCYIFFYCVISIPCAFAQSNAAVLAYGWSQKDQCVKVLLAYEGIFNAWTFPGGKKEQNQTITEAAAQELFEETAAYPAFSPDKTKPIIENIPDTHKFYTGFNSNTVTYALYLPKGVDYYENIGEGWKSRVSKLSHSYREMSAWRWFKLEDVNYYFKNSSKIIRPEGKPGNLGGPVRVQATFGSEGIDMRNVAYRALKNFAEKSKFDMMIREATPTSPEPRVVKKKASADTSPIMSDGVRWLQDQLKAPQKSAYSMLRILNGQSVNGRGSQILSRGPSAEEFNVIIDVFRFIMESSEISADQLTYKSMVTSNNKQIQKHQKIVWAVINTIRLNSGEQHLLDNLSSSEKARMNQIIDAV